MSAMDSGDDIDPERSGRLLAVAADLATAGLAVELHHTRAGLDITASLHSPGQREMDALIGEDGYTELRYWADPAWTSAEVASAIVRALSVLNAAYATSPQPGG
jgi:hypothetical protein